MKTNIVFTSTGELATLGRELGKGGEGAVYDIGLDDAGGKVIGFMMPKFGLAEKNRFYDAKSFW